MTNNKSINKPLKETKPNEPKIQKLAAIIIASLLLLSYPLLAF